jgi:uncharacterized membrane protein
MKAYLTAIFIFLLLPVTLLRAQNDVSFIGSSKQVVSVGERFTVVYEINGDGSNFIGPNFGALQVLSGPNTSTSSSVQYINGKMQQSYSKTFSYIVQAAGVGDVFISPAKITLNGKVISSNTLNITVVKQAPGQQGSQGSQNQEKREDGVIQDDDVYIRASVSKTNPYLGEEVIVTYRIYTKVGVSSLQMKKASSFQGFWSKNLTDNNSKLKQTTEVINGEEYIVAEISKYAIFPQKTGKLTIDPAEMDIVAQLQVQQQRRRSNDPFEDFFNDPFFNRNVRNVELTLATKPVTLDVKPLPDAGKPASFKGAVGDFSFKSEIDKEILKANDALTLKVSVSGKGNIELIEVPAPKFPSDFESYDPKISNNVKTSVTGISGEKKVEYLAIPRAAGDFVIEPIEFSYFNPNDKKYYSFSSGTFNIKVEKGDVNGSGITYSSSAKEDIKFIGKDIRHITTGPYKFRFIGVYFFGSTWYYILLVLPVFVLILFILLWKKMEKQRANISGMKTRKANKVAKTRLLKADKFKKEGNDKAFFDEIAQALWGYIADKFNIKQASLSVETVKEALTKKGVEEPVIDNFINTLNNIEFARFAPGNASGKMESVYKEALNAITQAEKALK